ncbi:MAG: uridine kinase [Bacteriovoracaceae bacterium]|nr:uridine kinase [Bacteriovoracaceae bacterium]
MSSTIIIGVAGGSGSGKTTFTKRLVDSIGQDNCAIVAQDYYYFDQSKIFDHDGGRVNFDHPNSLDFNLMASHLQALKCGEKIQSPIYCFKSHTRKKETLNLSPKRFIIVDGILILSQPGIRSCLDHKIFIDCPENLRFSRRLHRDTTERGRDAIGVENQFLKQVKPMHDQFVEPSKLHACDIIQTEDFDIKTTLWTEKLMASLRINDGT